MPNRPVVALIGLDATTANAISDHLGRRGHEARRAAEPWQAESLLAAGAVDVALIGFEADGEAALDLLRRHAGATRPAFLVLTRGAGLIDRVLALEMGAADVVEMPVPAREIAARVFGLLRRIGADVSDLLVLENATVDLRASLVMHRSGREELLSPGQLAMLRLFVSRPRMVLTRDDVLAVAPAEAADAFDRSIDSRIVRLRRKLDTLSIVTIRGAGYRFDPPEPRAG